MPQPHFSVPGLPRLSWLIALAGLLSPCWVFAQQTGTASSPSSGQPQSRITLPTVTVTAQKEPADARRLPVSVTTVVEDTIESDGIYSVGDAAMFAPNTYFTEFTARKLSNARFRGIGTSPANPGITTYIDGVPQLNVNSSSIEFLDVHQVEFVRGAQSALFGRNTLGGVVNISSGRPSLTKWNGQASVPFGNYSAYEARGVASGPLGDKVALGVGIGHGERNGFTTNDLTGKDIDYRSATFGKAQLLWTPTASWETRVIFSGERARDGDYALNDLAALRASPFHAARDFEGHTDRDVTAATVFARHEGQRIAFSTTTGFVHWKTTDETDLDYTPLPLATRRNAEKDFQFTEEVRLVSRTAARLSDAASLKWQAGAFVFTQNYDQDAVNHIAPFLLSPLIGFTVDQHSPQAALDDYGVSGYGQGTVTLRNRLDLAAGGRFDYENKKAALDTFFSPVPIAPPSTVAAEKSFSDFSPQVSLAYRFKPDTMTYASLARGFKAGGFNPASPPGSEAYGEESAWHLEGGLKEVCAGGRLSAGVAVFYIDWNDLQLNVPNPAVPAQFYISNVGNAKSSGVELELGARPRSDVDIFGAFGYTHARFGDGSSSGGVDVSGRTIPNTPDYTAMAGAQVSRPVHRGLTVYGRGEAVFYGAFKYDETNTQGQDAYSLANFRGGVRGKYVHAEAWVKNAFDTHYIPVAFPYPNFAPSGFIGESGHPRTFGITAGVSF